MNAFPIALTIKVMSEEWKKSAIDMFKKTSESATKLASSLKEELGHSDFIKKVEEAAHKATSKVSEHLDNTISSQKLAQSHQALQEQVEALTMKLDDALARIASLETRLKSKG